MAKELNHKLSKIEVIVGISSILLCASLIVMWNLQRDRLIDKSIITGVPCAPPCWQGIVPGVTSSHQALEILKKSPYIENGTIKQAGSIFSGGCTWFYRSPSGRIQPGLNWQNGIVDTIQMGLTFELTVQEAIEKFGYPEAVSVVEGGEPEHWYWIVILYYPSRGVELKAYTTEFSKFIKPTTEVGSVLLFSPVTLEKRINEINEGQSSLFQMNNYLDWKGYGDVAELYGGGRQWP